MQRIKEMLIEGYSYSQIIQDLHLNERTFYRWLDRLYREDYKALETQNNKSMLRAVSLHFERCSTILRGLQSLAQDMSQSGEVRLQAYHDMALLSQSLITLHGNVPLAAKKLREQFALLKTNNTLSDYISGNIYLPPAINPELNHMQRRYQDHTSQEQEQQQQQQQQREEGQAEIVRAGDPEESEHHHRRDWWNTRDYRP